MYFETPDRRKEISELLGQLASAQAEAESLANRDLNKAVDAASHAMLLRQAHDTIRETEDRFQQLVELSPLPIFIQSGGRFAYVNAAALLSFAAADPADMLGKCVWDFVHADFRSVVQQRVANLEKGETQKPLEQKLCRLDGSLIDAEVSALPITYEGKAAALVIVRDISKRRQAEQKFQESLALANAALESTNDALLIVNRRNDIVSFNQKFLQIWKLPRTMVEQGGCLAAKEALLSKIHVPDLLSARIAELDENPDQQSFDVLELKNGSVLEAYSHPHRVCDKVVGRVWSFRDITERRRGEEALRRSELRFRAVWNQSSDGMRLATADGTIIMANDAFCQMVGKPRGEIEGKPLGDVYIEGRRSHVLREHQRRFVTREVKKHLETDLVLWNGKRVWFEVANSFVELDGEQPLLLGIFRDITQRKQLELRGTAFSKLGEQLNSATTKEQAARIIVTVADELLGWDSCALQLYLPQEDIVEGLLNVDLIEGKRCDVPLSQKRVPPTGYGRRTIKEGPQLILRRSANDPENPPTQMFGDMARPSASLMFVPVKHYSQVIGIFTIQSYTVDAYNEDDLQTLQALADHCSGALQRLQADEERQQSEKRNAALIKLVRSLSAVDTQKEAANIIVNVAEELFGWDACNIDLYFPDEEPVLGVIVIDTIDGKRVTVPPITEEGPSATSLRVMEKGGELILRQQPAFAGDTVPFGSNRPSASLMNVPIRHGDKPIGVFSIQSYTRNAYRPEDLATLQALADHCGGTLERLRNAEKLRVSEQRFQIVAKATNDAIWDWDYSKNALWWNDGLFKLFGYRPEDAGSSLKFWTDRVHSTDRKRVVASVRNLVSSGGVIWSSEYRFRRADGSYAHIFDRGYVMYDSTGKPIRMIGAMMDISERKRVEQRHASFSKLGQHLSTATEPMAAAQIISEITDELFAWDAFTMDLYHPGMGKLQPLLNFDTINGERVALRFTEMFEEPSGRSQRIIKGGCELILKTDQQLSADATPFGDTSKPSASILYVPIRNKNAVIGIMSVQSYTINAYDHQDLEALQTLADHCGGALERIKAEQALRSSEVRFHSIWENSVDGMRLTDENGLIVAVNEAYCNLVGMKREELETQPFSVVYAQIDNQTEALEKYKVRFQQRIIEKTLTRRLTFRNGKIAELEDTNSFIEVPGQPPLLLALFRDITQQRQLESELRHSQKMESIGQLAGGIAHDFNNILTVVQGHASLLLMDRTVHPKITESIQQISHVADRAANLTRQLLTFSRKQVIQPKNLDLNEIVSNMTKLLQRVLGEDISLQVNFVAKLPLIHADPGMLEQILMNLAVNSRDAMPRGGKLLIATSHRHIEIPAKSADCKPGNYICLDVRDTGCGIPDEILPRIFEPFFTTKDVGKGTGLGLATVYGIVKQHSGWIDVESEVGKGTAFQIYLPAVASKDVMTDKKTAPAKMKGGDETILLVEDEAEVRGLAKMILQRLGYKLFEASSGKHALEIWNQHRDNIHIVVTDIVMPDGLTGRELADRLQLDKPELKVVFCSGYSTEMIGQDSILQEGINFLQKPYTPQKLAQIVRNRLDNRLMG